MKFKKEEMTDFKYDRQKVEKLAKKYFKSPMKYGDNVFNELAEMIADKNYDHKILRGFFNLEDMDRIIKLANKYNLK